MDDRTRLAHPGWRLLLFVAGAVAAVLLLANLTSTLAPEAGGLRRLAYGHSVLLAAGLLVSAVMMHWFESGSLVALGLPVGSDLWTGLGRGLLIGAALILVLVAVQLVPGWLRPVHDAGSASEWLARVSGAFLVLAVAAAAEEFLFRGYGFLRLVELFGVPAAVAVDAALFAALHIPNPAVGWLPLLNVGLAGVLLATVYWRSRSLWTAIGLHWAWNASMLVFDLPVSGIRFDVPGYDMAAPGPGFLTGGSFGPEGGALTTLALAAGIAWAVRSEWLARTGERAAFGTGG